MSNVIFKITQRHYDIITKQAVENLPQECGGFLGGRDFHIMAIQPIFNQHLYDKTDTFSFASEDVERAHQFFKKHDMDYYGLYHSHPSGVPVPSDQDISTGHKYHFIVGLSSPDDIQFRAWQVVNKKAVPLGLQIVSDKSYSSIDIHKESAGRRSAPNINRTMIDEASDLSEKIHNIKEERPQYDKQPPKDWHNSDFSTLA